MPLHSSFFRRVAGMLATALAAGVISPAVASAAPPPAPLLSSPQANEVPGRYIVALKRPDQGGPSLAADALAEPLAVARDRGGKVRRHYTTALRGFSADLPAAAVDALRHDPRVAYLQTVRVHHQAGGATEAAGAAQDNAPWHLDRIDQRNLPLNRVYDPPNDASGVNVYVLDSGVRATHTEFEGRAKGVYTSINDGNGTKDCANHGTFVSSHIAGKTYGVAKKANILAVRILNCNNSATTEQIVDGMDWTAKNATKPSVVNMSIESDKGVADRAMDDAAKGMIDSGLLLVLITGNFNKGDCQNSPKDPRAIIMGASTRTDSRNTGTNASSYGSCTTAFAPGADVTGAGKDSDTHTLTGWYGTSFAAPLATGTVALALKSNPGLTMAQAKDLIVADSTKNVLSNIGTGSPNRLLHVGGLTPPGDAPVVTDPGPQNTAVGTAVSLQIKASDPQNDPLTYTASSLPAGLSINAATGLITGTPTTAGSSTVTVSAKDPGNHTGSTTFTWTVGATGGCTSKQLVGNPGFEAGRDPWTGDLHTIDQFPEKPAHTGTHVAWLAGYGSARTEYIAQPLTLPANCKATLSLYLRIDTAEQENRAYDRMTVSMGGTKLATYSNTDAAPGYLEKVLDVSSFAGRSITLQFSATEDEANQTSFVIDDVTLTTQ
ncbi:S8 family serine peptidase [Streptomyces longwoodensis]|uniref:S8 family serine peptidase n=1 Tax=Streptomyces longwoodensis TaxID=68231 RepID=UPI002DD8A0F7|nr:S8 family serine peptidase [Streptomyces longwoodensis]WRY88542.1 S8 family peptidase [Streptomyces longwoodensis]WTI47164.1 S8 family peptidase [Streptomyces longwoodensis]WUC73440.1 S8 family peptidase [Streptomyces longwoodensis]